MHKLIRRNARLTLVSRLGDGSAAIPGHCDDSIRLGPKLFQHVVGWAYRAVRVGFGPGTLGTVLLLGACTRYPGSSVRLAGEPGRWELLRDDSPYVIRGAAGRGRLEVLASVGGNSIRTWDAIDIDDLLDEAHRHGISVTVGIWLEHERHGFDYDDPEVRRKQLDKVRACVLKYRDHPAVLMWALGNEVELAGDLDKALRAIEEAAALTKELDPHHPTMAVVAEIGQDKARRVREACPSIDVLGINSYGGAPSLPRRLTAQGWTGPYVITEFGPIGHWEGGHTPWGAPFEPSSSEKAEMYRRAQAEGVLAEMPGRCLGSYAFLWGHKQETTPTWFGMFLESGERTAAVDVMQELWTGKPPTDRAPEVGNLALGSGPVFEPGQTFVSTCKPGDPEGEPLRVTWVVRPESTDRRSGGDAERGTPDIPGAIVESGLERAVVRAPDWPGAYRLYVTVFDGRGGAGTANIPFLVQAGEVE
ncbi:MAG: hypothetical protein KJZ65_12335 [Phycisphaerales bacterium]|nr:hypothetical protein [Phycisphaerales bacterium]